MASRKDDTRDPVTAVAQPKRPHSGLDRPSRVPPASEVLFAEDGNVRDIEGADVKVVLQSLGETRTRLSVLENEVKATEERLSAVNTVIGNIPGVVIKESKDKFVSGAKKKELENLVTSGTALIAKWGEMEASRGKITHDALDAHAKGVDEQNTRFQEVYNHAKTFAKYEQLDNYFAKKMSAHKGLHHWWLIAFVGVIGVSLFAVAAGSDTISGWLPTWTTEKFTFGKSILLIAPFLGVSWILRICLRLSMLNLQLSEDADNKTVLLRTLAALESDDITKLEKEQRLVAYNAIFRSSLPNNSNLDIAQPSIGELAKLGK